MENRLWEELREFFIVENFEKLCHLELYPLPLVFPFYWLFWWLQRILTSA